MLLPFTILALLVGGQAAAPAQKAKPMTKTAAGTFEVKMLPPAETPVNDGYVHLSLDKTFAGPLEGTSRVEMMATSDGKSPSGGYVALEKFTGTLDGKKGSFVMQHSGIMSPGFMEIHIVVSPGSGTDELAGLTGRLEITRDGKQHHYKLKYQLP